MSVLRFKSVTPSVTMLTRCSIDSSSGAPAPRYRRVEYKSNGKGVELGSNGQSGRLSPPGYPRWSNLLVRCYTNQFAESFLSALICSNQKVL